MLKKAFLLVLVILLASFITADRSEEAPVIDVNLEEGESSTIVVDGEEVTIKVEEIKEENGEIIPTILVNDKRVVLTEEILETYELPIKIIPVKTPPKEETKDIPKDIVKGEVWIEIVPKHDPFVDLMLTGIQNDIDKVEVNVCNFGEIASRQIATGVTLALDSGSSAVKPLSALEPEDCKSITFSRKTDFNSATATEAKITVDPDGLSGDIHRENNFKKIPMFWKTVQPHIEQTVELPDLGISDLQIYPKKPTPNDLIYIAFKIRNLGKVPARLSWKDEGATVANVMAAIVYLNGGAVAFPRPVNPDVEYAYNPNAAEDESAIVVTSWEYPELTLQPGQEIGVSTTYKKQWNSPSLIKAGQNSVEVSVDQLFMDNPQSGIIAESDESNNRAKVTFDANADLSWDSFAYFPFCQRMNGKDFFVQTQIDRNGQPDFGPKTDFKSTVSYMYVAEDKFYASDQPDQVFDAVTLYDALYPAQSEVKDLKGREYKIFTREMKDHLGYHGFYYKLPRIDGPFIIGVVRTVHIPTGQEDKSLFFWDFKPEYPGSDCPQIHPVAEPEEQFVIETSSGKPQITKKVMQDTQKQGKKQIETEESEGTEKELGEKETLEPEDIQEKPSVFERFFSWLKSLF